MIDVKDLIASYSLQDLIKSADNYFLHVDKTALMRKPFNDLTEAGEVLHTFLIAVQGLKLPMGSRILDFGAGSCWSSRYLADFGYEVIACDVSSNALAIGRDMASRQFPAPKYPPHFLVFDGLRLGLPDASVDGILCLSAFHHVPNSDDVIAEFARVLKPWGVAALSEPGPAHSRKPQSQYEMANFTVIENDVDIDAIWMTASRVGFTDLEIATFYPDLSLSGLEEFKGFLNGIEPTQYLQRMRSLMQERRLFFLEKGEGGITTSKAVSGLDACIEQGQTVMEAHVGHPVDMKVTVKNTGTALWRPSDWPVGPVRLGPSLQSADGQVSYLPRALLPVDARRGVLPGETVDFSLSFTFERAGQFDLRLQMVAEFVAWFGPEQTTKLRVR